MGTNVRSIGRPVEARLELWRKRFREFASGSCTVDQFCKQVGVSTATFYYWRSKLVHFDEVRRRSGMCAIIPFRQLARIGKMEMLRCRQEVSCQCGWPPNRR